MTVSTSSAGISATFFECWSVMSIPISASTSMASGRTRVGCEPAERIVTPAGASERASPSAIWLRAEFATQRKRMPFTR
jgi:hypothetical protein